MSFEEAIEEMKSLSPSEAAIEMVLKHLEFYKNGLEREIESNRKNVSEIIHQDKIINEMAEQLAGLTILDIKKDEYIDLGDKEEVKQYFEKKIEEKQC